jgi:chromate transporter
VLTLIGATSFGNGRFAYFDRELNERRGWIAEHDLLEILSISQLLPGAVGGNLAVLIGRRLGGAPGAVWGLVAIYGPGALMMLAASMLYFSSGSLLNLKPLFHGFALAAAGLAVGNVLRVAPREITNWRAATLVPPAFVAIIAFHIPTILTVLLVGSVGVFLFRNERAPKKRYPIGHVPADRQEN